MEKYIVLIIGGGTAGISGAACLKKADRDLRIAVIDPAENHFYQPLYTLVGAGADKAEKTRRPMAKVIPAGVDWIKEAVSSIDPENNTIVAGNSEYRYDNLVVAPGLQIDWGLIDGLKETLGKNGVCSVYGYKESQDTWNNLKEFQGGKAIFTAAWTPVKCGGAAQKVMYLTDAYMRKNGLRNKSQIEFISSGTTVFAVKGFKETLQNLLTERNIKTRFHHDLIKVDGNSKKAWFRVHEPGKEAHVIEEKFDFLHVVPPQSAPDFIKDSPLALQEGKGKGWLDVDKYTLRHNRYQNVFGLGDVAGLPTAKTGAAIRKQAPVVIDQLVRTIKGDKGRGAEYNGYSACPILTDYKHVLLAEFGYENKPMPSFPINMTKPRISMYILKHYLLPWFYWNRMLKGNF
jgi:sulfide:quinone oxidoreductase